MCLIGRDIGFASSVTFSGEQVPGALGLGQLAAAAELPEVQVRLGDPVPPLGSPVREGGRRAEVGHAAGAGQLIDVGGYPLHDRRHRGAGNNGPVSTATASSFLNAAGTMGG
jgi:hypothetical protein